jgi:ABC-type uncharacterized transport system involved in gliding motility auxiliary subunit
MTIAVEEIADELVKLWSKWSVDYDDNKVIDELGELLSRLGLDPQADRALVQEAHALATKKMVAKGFRTIAMNVRRDDKPRQ